MDTEGLYVQETYVNQSEGYMFGETEVMPVYPTTVGGIFRDSQREYGRCVSRIYRDRQDGPPVAIGWVFEKKMQYEDTGEDYVREVWVTVHTAPPTVTTEYHELELGVL